MAELTSPAAEPFRERSGRVVAPGLRRIKFREAVRVIVISDRGSVLLFRDTDPGMPGSGWWVTPGGGIDPGESVLDAAVRELAEETGWAASSEQFRGPALTHVVIHGYSDQVLVQHEPFYVLRTPQFEVDTADHTELEKVTLTGHGWFAPVELSDRMVWPAVLPDLLAHGLPGGPTRDLGVVEESTVAVDAAERRVIDDLLLSGFPAGTVIQPR